jgi:predicted site-specific integrase-resolvase
MRERYLDLWDLAAEVGIHEQSAYRILRQGRIPSASKATGCWLVPESAVRQFAAAYRHGPGRKVWPTHD